MSSVDNRIVNMQFNNKQFQSGAADSVQALEDLESAIAGMGDDSGLEDLGSAVDSVGVRFGALQVAGVAALATIASTATQTALSLGKNLLGSITSTIFGAGAQRALDIQQAQFQFRGLGLDVKTVMQNATDAVTGTAFGLQEAATAATQFGGSGVKAGDEMTTALTAISGIAAQTGRSYTEIAQVMTGIAGVGKVTGQDLIQFGVRGLNVIGPLAEQLGKTQAQVREMVSNGEIDFKTFASAMNEAFGENATKANRTFTGALANMKAALSRIGADFFSVQLKPVGKIFVALGELFDEFRKPLGRLADDLGILSGGLSENIVEWIESLHGAKLIKPILEGLSNVIAPFVALARTMGEAWAEVFPKNQNQSRTVLTTLVQGFELLTRPLGWLAEQIPKLMPIFTTLFTLFKAGWIIVGGLGEAFENLVGKISDVGSAIIDGLVGGLDAGELQSKIIELANNILEWIKGALGIASPAAELVPVGEAIVQGIAQGIQMAAGFVLNALGTIAGAIINGFKQLFGDFDALDWAALFNAILAGGIFLAIRSFVKTLSGVVEKIKGIADTVTEPFDLMTQALEVMQQQVKADIIRNIAIAVGVLTASIVVLSLLDPKAVAIGLGFLSAEISILVGAIFALNKINPSNIVAASSAILIISSAMLVLTAAVTALGLLPLDVIAKGLGTIAIALGIFAGALSLMPVNTVGLPAAAAAILILAAAMNILAGALAILGAMDMGTLVTRMFVISGALQVFILTLSALAPIASTVVASSGAILILAVSMNVLALALAAIAKIKVASLITGLTTMGIALAIFVASLKALSAVGQAAIAGAGAIFVISAAMLALAKALEVIATLSLGEIAKGLAAMAIALGIFLVAAYLAANPYLSAGLATLSTTMLVFGAGIALVGLGLLAAATAFAIFATVFGAGLGVLIAGFTALLGLLPTFAQQLAASVVVFIQTIAAMAPELRKAFGEILTSMLGAVKDSIPKFYQVANTLIGTILKALIKNIPKVGKLFEVLIKTGLHVLRVAIPEYVRTGVAIIEGVLRGIADRLPRIIDAGTDLIIAWIKGMQRASNRVIDAAGDAIIDFLHGIADTIREKSAEFREAGLDIAKAIIEGLTGGFRDGVGAVVDAVKNLAGNAKDAFTSIFKIFSPSKVSHYWGEMIVAGLVNGIRDNVGKAVVAVVDMANTVVAAGDKEIKKLSRAASKEEYRAALLAERAAIASRQADEAQKLADKSPKNKALQKAAEDARDAAKEAAKRAKEAQRDAKKAQGQVDRTIEFNAADDLGKAEILTERAQALADKSLQKLAEANAAAKEAKNARGEERERLLEEADKAAKAAKTLAKRARKAEREAEKFLRDSIKDRLQGYKDEAKAAADQAKFDAATNEGKVEILEDIAKTAQSNAETAQADAERLIELAKKVAKENARRAQRLLDRADAKAAEAKAFADEAAQALQDAEQYKNQTAGSGVGNTNLYLSQSAMEDAARAIDRYTQSLQQAEEQAAAATPVYQFVQYNNSPESLSELEVYRQTKNLLSASEIKMGATG